MKMNVSIILSHKRGINLYLFCRLKDKCKYICIFLCDIYYSNEKVPSEINVTQ